MLGLACLRFCTCSLCITCCCPGNLNRSHTFVHTPVKVRKLIQQLMDAQLNDSSDDEGAKGGKKKGEQGDDDDEEWEEVDEEAEAEGDKAGAQQ